jgi:gliding motility-associated-like protein
MFTKKLLILLATFFLIKYSAAQTVCTALGQNPETTFPVCGTSSFSQTTVPFCGGKLIPGPCSADGVTDVDPYWYKFTCFTSGTLGFVITPNDLTDDYDWQLFDITNHDPSDVYTNTSLFVACDWTGITGLTGASSAGKSLINCATEPNSPSPPAFSSMPVLQKGHTYLLLVSHYTPFSQSGYALTFGGGTAVITDPTLPHMQDVGVSCDGSKIYIHLNKSMKCSSLAADGSDFFIQPASPGPLPPLVISARSVQCVSGFDMDSVILTLKSPLDVNSYNVEIKNGSDGNTLLDNCDNAINPGEEMLLTVANQLPTPMDSLTPVGCAPNVLQLVFSSPILCNTIAPDGSDFIVTGTSPVTVTSATGICMDGSTTIINVKLSAPIQQQGSYQIKLVTGKDGNTIINECGKQTPEGASLNFSTKDTVDATFAYTIKLSCRVDTVTYSHDGRDGINTWQWNFGNAGTSSTENVSIGYTSFGSKNATLIVSNGVCSDTVTETILLNNELKASFEGTNLACPGDIATFKDNSIGNIISWNWNFGNGDGSTLQAPPSQTYYATAKETEIPVTLNIEDNIGCKDSATQYIKVVDNCYIAVPSAFTPNNDGLNDYLYPLNAYKAINLKFKIYNRYGQLVFETSDWTNKWNGTFKGQPADAGTYVWLLQYTDSETGKKYFTKGTTLLIR